MRDKNYRYALLPFQGSRVRLDFLHIAHKDNAVLTSPPTTNDDEVCILRRVVPRGIAMIARVQKHEQQFER
jgi:hypothetical protein